MAKHIPFSQHEAVLLLDAYLETRSSDQPRQQVVKRVSDDLRAMATNQVIEIDEIYRNTNGISFQMASMESAFIGQTVMKPATRLFTETVKLYREDRTAYEKLLKEAKSMVANQQTTEEAFASWLAEKVSPSQLSQIWYCYQDIEAFCRKIGVLKQPLFMTTDLDVVKKVQKTVSQNKIFTITHRKRIKSIILAAQYYTAFIREQEEAHKTDNVANSAPTIAVEEAKELAAAVEPNTNSQVQHAEQVLPVKTPPQVSNHPKISDAKKAEVNTPSTRTVQQILEENSIPCLEKGPFYVFVEIDALTSAVRRTLNQQASDLVSITRYMRYGKVCWRIHLTGEKRTENAKQSIAEKPDSLKDNKEPETALLSSGDKAKTNADVVVSERYLTTSGAPIDASTFSLSDQSIEEQFFAYLRDTAKLSGKTCRDYITAIRVAESFARQHGFTDYRIIGNSSVVAEKVIGNLLKNDEFVALNLSHHHRYTAAFNRYIAFYQVKSDLNLDRQYEEQYPSLYSRLLAASQVYDDPAGLSLDRICVIIGTDDKNAVQEILDHVSWATKITIGIYSFSKNTLAVLDQLSLTETEKVTEPDDYPKDRFIEVLMQRYRNGMMFDSIDFDIFRETYEMLFEERLPFDDAELEKRLRCCGILYKDRLFPADGIIDPETREKLYAYIDSCFASGKTVLYYKAIFSDLASDFASCYTLADEEMLRVYLEFTAEKGKYFFTEKYLSIEQNVTIDHNAEVADFLLSAGKPMTIEAVTAALSHIPQEQVQNIIYSDSRFLCNFRGRNNQSEFFHKGIFEVSDEEIEAIAEIISGYIAENEYAIWTDVWNQIKEKMPIFLENNLYLSWLGVRNAIAPYFSGRFNFNSSVISSPDKQYEMKDIFQLFAKHHPSFSADDIYLLSKELDTPVALYLWAIAEVSVRVSSDLFVSKDQISFDVDAVDTAIGSFMAKEYICLREINSFLSFPNVGYEWNEYLLESYALSYSKKFMLLNNGMALYNAPGTIVKRGGAYTEFVDVCAAILADSNVELKRDAALNYLAEQNLITQRRYKNIDLAIQKAGQIRAGKR